jgi:hypothetical protein
LKEAGENETESPVADIAEFVDSVGMKADAKSLGVEFK